MRRLPPPVVALPHVGGIGDAVSRTPPVGTGPVRRFARMAEAAAEMLGGESGHPAETARSAGSVGCNQCPLTRCCRHCETLPTSCEASTLNMRSSADWQPRISDERLAPDEAPRSFADPTGSVEANRSWYALCQLKLKRHRRPCVRPCVGGAIIGSSKPFQSGRCGDFPVFARPKTPSENREIASGTCAAP